MAKVITAGSFYNTASPLHSMDPRVKLVLMTAFMASVMFAPAPWGFIPAACMLAAAVPCSRVPVRIVARACRPLWFIVVPMTVANVFLVHKGAVVVSILGVAITDQALIQSGYMAFRVFALMMAGVLFSLVTSPISITDGVERLLAPLERFGVPVNEVAMTYVVAIRFMPILLDETRKVVDAQASRGARFDEGGLITRARSFVPILVPLFASALRHAEELGCAMEARCYVGGEGRTHYHVLKVGRVDYAAMAVFVLYLASLVAVGMCC